MAAVVIWQPAVVQHAPGQGLGLQLVPAPIQKPPKKVLQMACVVTLHVCVMLLQHAPEQGSGLQTPKGK